jgi:hypothetical protein
MFRDAVDKQCRTIRGILDKENLKYNRTIASRSLRELKQACNRGKDCTLDVGAPGTVDAPALPNIHYWH